MKVTKKGKVFSVIIADGILTGLLAAVLHILGWKWLPTISWWVAIIPVLVSMAVAILWGVLVAFGNGRGRRMLRGIKNDIQGAWARASWGLGSLGKKAKSGFSGLRSRAAKLPWKKIAIVVLVLALIVLGYKIYSFLPSKPVKEQVSQRAPSSGTKETVAQTATGTQQETAAATEAAERAKEDDPNLSLSERIEATRHRWDRQKEAAKAAAERAEANRNAAKAEKAAGTLPPQVASRQWAGPAWGIVEWLLAVAGLIVIAACAFTIYKSRGLPHKKFTLAIGMGVLVLTLALSGLVAFGGLDIYIAWLWGIVLATVATLALAIVRKLPEHLKLVKTENKLSIETKRLESELKKHPGDAVLTDQLTVAQADLKQAEADHIAVREDLAHGYIGALALVTLIAAWIYNAVSLAGWGILGWIVATIVAVIGFYSGLLLVKILAGGLREQFTDKRSETRQLLEGKLKKAKEESERLAELVSAYKSAARVTLQSVNTVPPAAKPKAVEAATRAEDGLEKVEKKMKTKTDEIEKLRGEILLVSHGPWANAFLNYFGETLGIHIHPNPIDDKRARALMQVGWIMAGYILLEIVSTFFGAISLRSMFNLLFFLTSWSARALFVWLVAKGWVRRAEAEELAAAEAAKEGKDKEAPKHKKNKIATHFWDALFADFIVEGLENVFHFFTRGMFRKSTGTGH